jgi:hypothetical protein
MPFLRDKPMAGAMMKWTRPFVVDSHACMPTGTVSYHTRSFKVHRMQLPCMSYMPYHTRTPIHPIPQSPSNSIQFNDNNSFIDNHSFIQHCNEINRTQKQIDLPAFKFGYNIPLQEIQRLISFHFKFHQKHNQTQSNEKTNNNT